MPLVTLTSDIGQQDYLVGAVKGRLLRINPEFSIIDISHSLSPFNYPQAAYVCRSAIKNFPEYTFHIVLINLFESKPDQLLLAYHKDQYIICADNGLLSMILEEKPEMVIGVPMEKTAIKNTLYCIEVAAKAITQLLNGEPLHEIGVPDPDYLEKNPLRPTQGEDWIEGQIIFIDNFENVIVNITQEQFEQQRKGRRFKIVFKRDEVVERISGSYADVAEGEKLVLFNSAGYMEIAINKGNAAGLFGLKGYSENSQQLSSTAMLSRLFYQTVKVYFE
ncbi:MAG: SAM-dependent chlorinase/fluorinase [Bacteroidota bacterium]|jgi:S-adenosylmethionine hydrolase|nr:SAM-dependent chlorinase/fluorinase [Bacteroidota bacterium]